jgi:hypothetical protein
VRMELALNVAAFSTPSDISPPLTQTPVIVPSCAPIEL